MRCLYVVLRSIAQLLMILAMIAMIAVAGMLLDAWWPADNLDRTPAIERPDG